MLLFGLTMVFGLIYLVDFLVNNSKWHKKKVNEAHKIADEQLDIAVKKAKKYAERQVSLLYPDEK